MFLFSGLGGAWMPLETTPQAFQSVGRLLPSAWSIIGFENILIRGLGMASVWLPAGVMLIYALGFLALATWRFRFE
jgi:ABC-2 type transport system permease protein